VKVVLFCGGLGMRIREDSERLPKPMIPVGDRPILLHIMRYFAAFGHKDFIICLGYKAEAIKDYFLNYNEALSNDFILTDGGRSIELLQRDIDEWSITFVNTGLQATIGERLKAVAPHLEGEEIFLANYGDVLTDAPLRDMVRTLTDSDAAVLFLAPRPTHTFHIVSFDGDNRVSQISDVTTSGIRINGGYFVLRREVLDYLQHHADLVNDAIPAFVEENRVLAYPYDGFWAPMDTLKDKQELERLVASGRAPWSMPVGLGQVETTAEA
jgi:glucose-1-phosphate cytidylyltransferase